MTKAVRAQDWANFKEETRGLERDFVGELIASRKVAFRLAYIAGGLAIVAVAAVAMLAPLKKTDVVVVKVDKATGYTEVATKLQQQSPTQGEATDMYWLRQYVLKRETYDYNTVQDDYNTTMLLSSSKVQSLYSQLYAGKNGLDKQLKDNFRIVVGTKSVTISPTAPGTAVVRFWTEKRQTTPQVNPPVRENWIATIGYEYLNAKMTAQDRLVNPLGFQVTTYRVDAEVDAPTAPAPAEAVAVASAPMDGGVQ